MATHPSHRSPSLPPHLAQHTPQHSAAGPSGQPDWPPPPSLLAGGSLGRRPLLPLPPPPPLPATPSLHAAATPPAVNGWGSSMGAANGWATPGSEVEAWGQQPLPPPPPLFFTALPGLLSPRGERNVHKMGVLIDLQTVCLFTACDREAQQLCLCQCRKSLAVN